MALRRVKAINTIRWLATWTPECSLPVPFMAANLYDRYSATLKQGLDVNDEKAPASLLPTGGICLVTTACFLIAHKFHDGERAAPITFYQANAGCSPQLLAAEERNILRALDFDILAPHPCVYKSMVEIQKTLDLPNSICELSIRRLACQMVQVLSCPAATDDDNVKKTARMIMMNTCWSVGAHSYYFAVKNWQKR
mmetsp:Transcript_24358/g.42489  ORF Transcript_24358/g.42489 Transcript_24358/m.42489 type:complete len:196 (-) Transcript_24358:804-1391(-)